MEGEGLSEMDFRIGPSSRYSMWKTQASRSGGKCRDSVTPAQSGEKIMTLLLRSHRSCNFGDTHARYPPFTY